MPNPLNRFTKAVEDSLPDDLSMITDVLEDENYRLQLTAFIVFFTTLLMLRISSTARLKALKGEHVLDLSNLNDANLFKEVFLAYLNAAILEPLLAIGGLEAAEGAQMFINLLTLGSICWWIWLITDAFDFEDVTQFFKYHVELRAEQEEEKDPARFSWLRLKDTTEDARLERKVLSGSVSRDVALWFMMACILTAWLPGPVSHRDVVHAYVVLFFWSIMHHMCRRATTWSTAYYSTFLFPSTALMPLEYCLPLMDVADTVEDLAFLETYREFIVQRTGVELIIES